MITTLLNILMLANGSSSSNSSSDSSSSSSSSSTSPSSSSSSSSQSSSSSTSSCSSSSSSQSVSSSSSSQSASSESGTAMPKFTDKNGNTVYYWAEWNEPNSDRADLTELIAKERVTVEHNRNDVIANREILTTRGTWTFIWHDIDLAMVQNLQTYSELDRFRYYPDGQQQSFNDVYCPRSNGWRVVPQRGGVFVVTMSLRQFTSTITSSSSSQSSSSSSISSSSSSSSSIGF